MRLRFTPRALRQFTSIAEYIARDDRLAARRVGERIQRSCVLLAQFPDIGREGVRAGTRERSVPGLPYIIVHRVTADEIVILGIYHSAQLRPE
jgi:plasmid stabilization system protein ParE